jgi:hypothetical protein
MYEAADHATGKPLVFCQRCEKQLAHPNNNNTSAGAFSTHFKSVSCQRGSANKRLLHIETQSTGQVSVFELLLLHLISNLNVHSLLILLIYSTRQGFRSSDGLLDSSFDSVSTHYITTLPLGLKKLPGWESYVRVRTLSNKRSNKQSNEPSNGRLN